MTLSHKLSATITCTPVHVSTLDSFVYESTI